MDDATKARALDALLRHLDSGYIGYDNGETWASSWRGRTDPNGETTREWWLIESSGYVTREDAEAIRAVIHGRNDNA